MSGGVGWSWVFGWLRFVSIRMGYGDVWGRGTIFGGSTQPTVSKIGIEDELRLSWSQYGSK